MKPFYTLLLCVSILLCGCGQETVTCEDPGNITLRLYGYTMDEVRGTIVNQYARNGRFDSLEHSTLVILYPTGPHNVAYLNNFITDTADYELIIAPGSAPYRLTEITKEAPHTETFKRGFNKKMNICVNDWISYKLNGEKKPFSDGYYIDVVK